MIVFHLTFAIYLHFSHYQMPENNNKIMKLFLQKETIS